MPNRLAKPQDLRDTVDEIMDRWRAGDPPNAQEVFDEMPELLQHHSLAIDLAYEEYCLLEESGEAPDLKQFCNKYSRLRHSLGRMLKLHGLMHSKSLEMPHEKAVDWPIVGKQWLDWLFIEEIGRGAFSRVFLAEEPALGNRRVVVKCSISGPGEAFVLGKFSHPNVMPIHSVRTDEQRGLVGICMPLLGRVTLAQVLDRVANSHAEAISPRVFSPEYGSWPDLVPNVKSAERKRYCREVVRLVERVARGLAAAHELKVLHGDIKPSNILLSVEGEPLLVDFNLSVSEQSPQQRMGGTPPYMAPERLPLLTLPGLKAAAQRNVESSSSAAQPELEYRSDVFSLGVMLYELLFGIAPFELQLDELNARYEAIRAGDLIAPNDVAGQPIAYDLAAIVRRAIALDPAERFSTSHHFADALSGFLEGQSSQERFAKRRRLFGSIALGTFATAFAVIAAVPIEMWTSDYWLLRSAILDIEEENFVLAAERLQQLRTRRKDPLIDAWLGYCFAKLDDFPVAKLHFEHGMPDQDGSGILWHNIGCCQVLDGEWDQGVASFDRALAANSNLRHSYAQRAFAHSQLSLLRKQPAPLSSFNDMEYALHLGPTNPHLDYDAATVFAIGSKYHSNLASQARSAIQRAMAGGIKPAKFNGQIFSKLEVRSLTPKSQPSPLLAPPKSADFLPPERSLRAILH